MSRFLKTSILAFPLVLLTFYSNCGQVNFSSSTPQSANNISGPNPGPTPPPVQLSPYVNAVAWEDLYYLKGTTCTSNCPDYDYNDFLTEFKIQDVTDTNNNITDIYIDFYPRAVGAGYDHSFKIVLTGTVTDTSSANYKILPVTKPMFNGSAQVSLTYYNQNGNVLGTPTTPPYNQDIMIFPSTHAIFGNTSNYTQIDTILPSGFTSGVPSNYIQAQQNARLHITLANPAANPAPANGQIDPSTFRVILHVIPTNYDVDIINVDPTNFDDLGYPWGFIIPTDWQWMQEGVNINSGYPLFQSYRQYLLGTLPANTSTDYINWFNHPTTTGASSTLYPSIPFTEFLPAIP